MRAGTRMLRVRTLRRVPSPAQPERVTTDPRVEHRPVTRHTCSECFGPRSMYAGGFFCARCEQELFGMAGYAYKSFIRSEKARRRKQWKQ